MLLLSVSLALSLQGPDLAKKISFTSVAKPAEQMFVELSKQAGFVLNASAGTSDETLVLHFSDVPIGEAMKRIATAMNAEWQSDGVGYRLIRSPARSQQEQAQTLDARAAAAGKAIEKRLKAIAPGGLTTAKAEEIFKAFARLSERRTGNDEMHLELWTEGNRLERGTALGILCTRLLAAIDPREIAKMEEGQRLVFSTAPNRMQRPFTGDTRQALRQFSADQAVWTEIAKGAGSRDREGGGFFSWALHGSELLLGDIKKVLLAVSLDGPAETASFELKVLDGKGQVIGQISDSLYEETAEDAAKPKDEPVGKEEPIELSPTSQEFQLAMAARHGEGGKRKKPAGSFREALLNPETNDPLSFITSEALIGSAKAKGRNLVACLPDDSVFVAGLAPGKPVLPSAVIRAIGTSETKLAEELDWYVVYPSDRLAARSSRIDRKALGEFVRALEQKGRITLDDAARLALAIKQPSTVSHLIWSWVGMLGPDDGDASFDHDLNLLRLYGSLSTSQRTALQQGSQVSFISLSPAQRTYLGRLIFGSYREFQMKDEEMETEQSVELFGLLEEPTELLPNGLVPPGYLTMKGQNRKVVYASASGSPYGARAMTAEELAWHTMYREDTTRFSWAGDDPPLDRFTLGEQLQVTFEFHVTPLVYSASELYESLQPAGAKPLLYKELPEELRAEIEKKVAELKKMFEGVPARGNRKPPPPARWAAEDILLGHERSGSHRLSDPQAARRLLRSGS